MTAAIGAASSGVTKLFLDDAVAAGIITFSPANTSVDFIDWDDNDLYWRTAPADTLQGEVLGNLLAEDGKNNVAVLYQNDSYGTGLTAVFKETFEASGGTVVEEQSYNTGDKTFDAQISAILASNPEAILLVTFNEIYTVGPALLAAGYPAENLYLVDGNLKNFSVPDATGLTWPAELSLEGAKGTTPAGPAPDEDFQARVSDWWVAEGNAALTDFSYANESYDAVILLALASLAANSTDPADVAAKLQEVSGGSGDGDEVHRVQGVRRHHPRRRRRGLRRLLRPDHLRRQRRPDRGHHRCLPVRCRQQERAYRPLGRSASTGAPERSGAPSRAPGAERARTDERSGCRGIRFSSFKGPQARRQCSSVPRLPR